MPHLDSYPFDVTIPLPTDEELGPEAVKYLHEFGRNYKDGRMMLGTGIVGKPMIELARSVFRVEGVDPKIREFVVLRIAKLLGGVNPWGPNLRMLDNLGASDAEKEAIQADGPVAGLDEDATLIMRATEEITVGAGLQDPTLRAMIDRFGNDVARRYIVVICWYNMFNRFLIATRVPAESEQEIVEKVGDQTMPA
jgi:hypothetical protein